MNTMDRMNGRIALASLLVCLSHGVADAQDVGTPWETCLKAPVRACVLDEALALALPIGLPRDRARLLGSIMEAWAKGGDLDQALRVAKLDGDVNQALRVVKLVPDGPPITALLAIAEAQEKAGRRKDAGETIERALQLAYSLKELLAIAEAQAKAGRRKDAGETIERALQWAYSFKDRLLQAQWLHAIARTQMETGATAEAAVTFDQALQSAQSVWIDDRPGPDQGRNRQGESAFWSLDRLLKGLATEQADAGQIVEALQTARSIKHDAKIRADALRAISAVQSTAGSTGEAAATLDEALEAVRQAQSSPVLWPHYDWRTFVEMLCDIAKMQAGNGMTEKAATTIDEALRVVSTIRDAPAGTRDWATAVALADIAESQREAGLASAALATLDRAVKAATAAKQDYWWALAKVAEAQARFGLATAAATTIDLAIERARALGQESQRAMALSDIARICAEIGLRAEAARIFDEALEFARAIADEVERGNVLLAIAEIQLKAGLLDRAEASFGEALSGFLSSQNWNRRKLNLALYLNQIVRGDMTTRFIAASPALRPQIVQIVQTFYAGSARAAMLCDIAKVMPN
jgi:tetratricopeptide (TPR) repeat protein